MEVNMLKEVIAEACRIEYEEKTGKLFIVFEVTNEKHKQDIKKNWTNSDIEYRLIDKSLVQDET
jgi:hypothetical protein